MLASFLIERNSTSSFLLLPDLKQLFNYKSKAFHFIIATNKPLSTYLVDKGLFVLR